MHPDLHRHLDGELPREALSPDARADLEAWAELSVAARELGRTPAPAFLETRVMASLPQEPKVRGARRWLAWLLQPRAVTIRPVYLGAVAAAALAAVLLWPEQAPPVATEPEIYVQFVLAAPEANGVAVAGDFNHWSPGSHLLRDPDGDGVWTGLFSLTPGMHKYMFVVDGEQWVTDPQAERYIDDGFGMKNALISVAADARQS